MRHVRGLLVIGTGARDGGKEGNRRSHDRRFERGASLVEFALILPIVVVLMIGIVTGGIGLNRNISLNNSAREAARYGATLPVNGDMTAWLNAVKDVAITAATGELDDGEAGRTVCVAFVYPDGGSPTDQTTRLELDAAGVVTITTGNVNNTCVIDGRPDGERRVQVRVNRETELDVVFWSRVLTLEADSTARFEREGL